MPAPESSSTLSPPRKKGGQPCNSNALRHGLYSVHNPHPQKNTLKSMSASPLISIPVEGSGIGLMPVVNHVQANRAELLHAIAAVAMSPMTIKQQIPALNFISHLVGYRLRDVRLLDRLGGDQPRLRRLAHEMHTLFSWDLSRHSLPPQTVFVSQKNFNFHTNSVWVFPRLMDAQWHYLADALAAFHHDRLAIRNARGRHTPPLERLVLEGIFLKLATSGRWQDLPHMFPVRRCQDAYRQLVNSGYMSALNRLLLSHLDGYGSSTLGQLVHRGCFIHSQGRVLLAPGRKLTWENYTALVLLQQVNRIARAFDLQRAARFRRHRFMGHNPSTESVGLQALTFPHYPLYNGEDG